MTIGFDVLAMIGTAVTALCKIASTIQEFNQLDIHHEDLKDFLNRQKTMLETLDELYRQCHIYCLTIPDDGPRLGSEQLKCIVNFLETYKKTIIQGEEIIAPLEEGRNQAGATSKARQNFRKAGMVAGGITASNLGSINSFNIRALRCLAEADGIRAELIRVLNSQRQPAPFNSIIRRESRLGRAAASAYSENRQRSSSAHGRVQPRDGNMHRSSSAKTLFNPNYQPTASYPEQRTSTVSIDICPVEELNNSIGTHSTSAGPPAAVRRQISFTSSLLQRRARMGSAAAGHFRLTSLQMANNIDGSEAKWDESEVGTTDLEEDDCESADEGKVEMNHLYTLGHIVIESSISLKEALEISRRSSTQTLESWDGQVLS
ncbi:hypothetical protein DFH27DRAFT_91193 [Peziza echinospora]|nr:hypothetical protein DFH27DRAFT_91193 [Peziza echinospora]